MSNTIENNKRLAKNTIVLYLRMLLILVVSLYTSRVVLNALGVVDFGIYNVVGGLVAMFSLISASISTSITRFMTFELGKGDQEKLKRVFSTAINIQIAVILIILILAETVGLWFLNNRMTIPEERIVAANWVYQFSLISFSINLISMPYNAVIVAHEKMTVFAYISILEVSLKLAIVFLLAISPWDKLIFYALMLMMVALLIRLSYGAYCKRHFAESSYSAVHDKQLLREMASFTGWNYLGAGASILRTYGVNVLMNVYFGPVMNAARGVSTQVESAVNQLTSNFTMAINPQITKSYAKDDLSYTHSLICAGSKFAYLLTLILVIPIFCEAPMLLRIWLKTVPDNTVLFLRLTLIASLIDSMTNSMQTAVMATGDIKKYSIFASSIVLLIFPVSLILYEAGLPAYVSYVVVILAMISKVMIQIPFLRSKLKLPINIYFKEVIMRIIMVTLLSSIVPLLIELFVPESLMRFISVIFLSTIIVAVSIYFAGLTHHERMMINQRIIELKRKFLKK